MKPITLAAIDIGSNAARLLIKKFDETARTEEGRIEKIMFMRVPLRLGMDVFTSGKISKQKIQMTIDMIKGFCHFMNLYHVDKYQACATSAMRDASNGKKILKKIEDETGIHLAIIPGEEEAKLLCNNIIENERFRKGNFAYVDVGGGSTEISLLHDGELSESHSFNVGTIRMLNDKTSDKEKTEMLKMLEKYSEEFPDISVIGSGGNINKLYKLSKSKKSTGILYIKELQRLEEEIAPLSLNERKEKYHLRNDRADVILPAARIFLSIAEALKSNRIIVPNMSFADSIVDSLYRKTARKKGKKQQVKEEKTKKKTENMKEEKKAEKKPKAEETEEKK